jgi:hypothetical protein
MIECFKTPEKTASHLSIPESANELRNDRYELLTLKLEPMLQCR